MRTEPDRRHLTPAHLAFVALAMLAAGCGTSEEPLPEPEAESTSPPERTEAAEDPAPSTSAPAVASTSTSVPASSSTAPPTTDGPATTTTPTSGEGVRVLSVTDGDTFRVLVDGENEPLRLIGINAPESGECLAAQSTRRLAELVGHGPVRLETDVSDRDDFGRLLRYAHAADVFVNEVLVREGLALARRYEPDTARSDELEAAQAAAAEEGVGIWDPTACGAPGEGTVEVGDIRYDADGDDNHNLNDEWVEIVNPGDTSVDLTGWSVKDESATHRYRFPSGFHLDAGATVRIHTGCGQDTSTSLYWCNQGSAVWNNSGDTVFVLDPNGNMVVSRSYTGD